MKTISRLINAVFPRQPEPSPTPWPVKIDYNYVPVPDAVAELANPSEDEGLDFLHSILIDLLQRNLIRAVRRDDDTLGYIATEAGRKYVQEQLGSLGGP